MHNSYVLNVEHLTVYPDGGVCHIGLQLPTFDTEFQLVLFFNNKDKKCLGGGWGLNFCRTFISSISFLLDLTSSSLVQMLRMRYPPQVPLHQLFL